MALVLVSLSGCVTSQKSGYQGTAWNIGVPAAKDVEILGLVHYEGLVESGTGEKITYDALLREAEKLGGNGIANIMIDVKRDGVSIFGFIFNPKETWYGSALAIKYTNENLSNTLIANDGKTVIEGVPISNNVSDLEPPASLLGKGGLFGKGK